MDTRQTEAKKRKHVDTFKPTHSQQNQPASTSRMQVEEGPNRSQIQQKNARKLSTNHNGIYDELSAKAKCISSVNILADRYESKVLNNNKVKMNAIKAEVHLAVTELLNGNGIQWLTFEDKQMRDIKVMIKVLHHSIDPTDIIQELNRKGLKARNATNKQKWLMAEQRQDHRAKGLQEVVPLDMSIVSFD
jgi:hypothetical protein